jgi:thioredoxin-dependent peroxiredoxin
MAKPQIGKSAPDFELNDSKGKPVKLSGFKGKKVVIYFYPRDNTPGCTAEACRFRDEIRSFTRTKAVIIGISPDSESSHVKFSEKYELPFTLLSDPGRKVCKLWCVLKKKKMYGKEVLGIERSTFVIDEAGMLQREFRGVKVDGHVEEVLLALKD